MLRSLKIIRYIFNGSNFIVSKNDIKISHYMKDICLRHRMISFDTNDTNSWGGNAKRRKKTVIIPKIILIDTDNNTSLVSLETANKIAKRRNLELELMSERDPKTDRSIYKFISHKHYKKMEQDDRIPPEKQETYKSEHKKKKDVWKPIKMFIIKITINSHDLDIKINNINKSLKKLHKIKIFINHPDGAQKEVIEAIKSKIQGTPTSEKVTKGTTSVMFTPLEKTKSDIS